MTGRVEDSDFRAALSRLGVGSGSRLIAHSSLSSFGWFEGGAEAVARTLVDHVGRSGLIVMPAFTYGREPFERGATPTPDGAVAEAFWRLPGAIRSDHPTHSVAAAGDAAAEVTADHDPAWPCGDGSPLHRAVRRGGAVLLIGVGHRANSLLHVAQCLAHVPYLDRFRDAPVRAAGSEVEMVRVRRAGCSRGFDREADRFREAALIEETFAGDSRLLLFDGERLLREATEVLKMDPLALACTNADCTSCDEAREMTEATP